MEKVTEKFELTQLANKLFMYTDAQDWNRLLSEVFTEMVWFDVSSVGGGDPKKLPAKEIREIWKQGFDGLDGVHHQAGHYLIRFERIEAIIFGYAVAYHYKESATKGKTRSFIGSYDLKAIQTERGWRLSQFKYNLKFIDGNITLE